MEYNVKSDKKYKIAIISDYFQPRLGGIESHVKDLATTLASNGHKVRLVTSTFDYSTHNTKAVKLFETHHTTEKQNGYYVDRIFTKLPANFPYAFYSSEHIKAIIQDADIVHIHVGVISPFSQQAVKIAQDMGKPVVVTWHCVLGALKTYCKYCLGVKKWVERGAVMTAVSTCHAKQLEETFSLPFEVLPNAINVQEWAKGQRLDENKNNSETLVRICASMRFTFRKRVLQLVRIMSKVDRQLKEYNKLNATYCTINGESFTPKDFTLDLYGNGTLTPVVKMLIKIYGLENKVFLRGRKTKQELKNSYHNKDIYVVTCLTESFGIAALEARTAGLPIVARKNTGVSDFVLDDVNGKLCENDEEMVEEICNLIMQNSLREEIKNTNTMLSPTQDWNTVYEQTISYYEKAITNIQS